MRARWLLLLAAACGESLPLVSGPSDPRGPVCPGDDRFEDNDELERASPLDLDGSAALIAAGVEQGDRDLYSVIAPRRDPLRAEVVFVGAQGSERLELSVIDAGGEPLAIAEGSTEIVVWSLAPSAGATMRVRVRSNHRRCTPYDLGVSFAACSDAREDDDLPMAAAAMPPEGSVEGSLFSGDDDLLLAPPGPQSCEVLHHDPEARVDLAILSEEGEVLAEARAVTTGGGARAELGWTAAEPVRFVRLRGESSACVAYRLSCVTPP
jgi:hypothetical protein